MSLRKCLVLQRENARQGPLRAPRTLIFRRDFLQKALPGGTPDYRIGFGRLLMEYFNVFPSRYERPYLVDDLGRCGIRLATDNGNDTLIRVERG